MILTAANLFYYLADRNLATAESVVDGSFRVVPLSRRNQVYKASSYIVKQVKEWRPGNIRTFQSEVHWYWLAQNHPGFEHLGILLAKCYAYDAENEILIFEPPPDAEDLDRHYRRTRTFSEQMARLTGETLAQLHTALSADKLEGVRADFAQRLPWAFSAHQLNDLPDDPSNDGVKKLIAIVRENSRFGEAFEEQRNNWQSSTLINGDMKWAHCILTDENQRMYFIDWEMASFGDPCWDAGAILQEYLLAWLRSIPSSREAPIEELLREARLPLSELQPSIRIFWESYIAGLHIDPEEAAAKLGRAMRYAACWLIQSAYQGLKDSERITPRAVRMAQLSLNMLSAPAETTQTLLGL